MSGGAGKEDSLLGLSRYYNHRIPPSADDFFFDALGAEEIMQRCADIRMRPGRILDFGARLAVCTRALIDHYPGVPIVSWECSHALLSRGFEGLPAKAAGVACDAWPLPFEDECFDMVAANFSLSFLPDSALSECARLLRPGGVLLLTCFGQRTLVELRQSFADLGARLRQRDAVDVVGLGNRIVASARLEPVVDCREYQLDYDDLHSMRRDLCRAGVSYRAEPAGAARSIESLRYRGRVTVEIITAVAFR